MSRNEGFPTATIEAMYCGVPVITSDIPQFKEQLKQGYNGYLIPLEDYNALAKKLDSLKDISKEDYDVLCEGAINSFKELSLQNVCKKLISIYKQITI
jgi:glycosyltransferase involved in cell wall biosynthesis